MEPSCSEMFELTRDGQPTAVVVPPRGDTELEDIALADFTHYVAKASGAKLRVRRTGARRGTGIVSIRVGQTSALPRHGFSYRITPQRLWLIGADPRGLANGVHWFLREKLGVRWYLPTELGEEIPRRPTIQLAVESREVAPEFEWIRMTGNRKLLADEVMWGVRHGDDILDNDISLHWHFQLNWQYIVPPTKENVEKHPTWFAREEGEAPVHNPRLNVCTTNPEVLRRFVEACRKAFEAKRKMYSLEPNDQQRYCQCRTCKEAKARLGPGATGCDEFAHFCNTVARGVRETHPDGLLGFYAYGHHMWAPRVVKPDPMLAFMMCRHGGRTCTRHSLLDGRCSINAAWRDNFERWCEYLERRGYYGYWGNYGWFGPEPTTRLARDLPYLKERRVRYLCSENRFSWATNAPFYYLALRLCQDTGLVAETVLDDFYRGVYGPAYEPMRRYWQRWAGAWEAAPCRDSQGYHYEKTYPLELVRAAHADLKEADALAADAPERYRQRLALARIGLRFTKAYLRMLGEAEAGHYVAAVETGERIAQIIRESASLPGPAAFARHPSATETQMSLDRVNADMGRYRKEMEEGK